MRRMLPLLLALLLCLAPLARAEEPRLALYYFYEELCGSCDGAEAFDVMAAEALSGVRELYPYDLYRVNVYTTTGEARYADVCAEMGIDPGLLTLPVLIAGGRVFQGDEAIAANLREAYLVAGEDMFVNDTPYNPAQKKTGAALFDDYAADPDAVTVVYFYRITCEECIQTAPLIDALPETVVIDGVERTVSIVRINTRSGNNGERVTAFFNGYDVPNDARMVPIAFTAGAYFAGHDAIAEGLVPALTEVGFSYPPVE